MFVGDGPGVLTRVRSQARYVCRSTLFAVTDSSAAKRSEAQQSDRATDVLNDKDAMNELPR